MKSGRTPLCVLAAPLRQSITRRSFRLRHCHLGCRGSCRLSTPVGSLARSAPAGSPLLWSQGLPWWAPSWPQICRGSTYHLTNWCQGHHLSGRRCPSPNVDVTLSAAGPTSVAPDFATGGESDDFITPEIQLEIAFKVICQLDKTEERSLLAGEQSLLELLKAQVVSLKLAAGMHEIEVHMLAVCFAHSIWLPQPATHCVFQPRSSPMG
jgi:hypothetical protein